MSAHCTSSTTTPDLSFRMNVSQTILRRATRLPPAIGLRPLTTPRQFQTFPISRSPLHQRGPAFPVLQATKLTPTPKCTLNVPTFRTMSSTSAMGKRLAGKTILITGASSGIGRSTAMEFARTAGPGSGIKLILTARRLDTLKQIAEDIKKEIGADIEVLPVKLDVSNADEVRNLVGGLPAAFKEIDVLINNAGMVRGVERAPDIKEEDIRDIMDINVIGLINMTQAIMPIFQKRGESGQGDIINVGSIAGREGYPGGSIYCATKAAVRTFTDAMRKELIASRIRIMEIDPGQVETEFSLVRFRGDAEKAANVYKGCEPLTPEDIAEIIVFMAGRRENVVVADTMVFPNHQASATQMHKTS